MRIQPIWESIVLPADLDALDRLPGIVDLGFPAWTTDVCAPFVGERVGTGNGEGKDWKKPRKTETKSTHDVQIALDILA